MQRLKSFSRKTVSKMDHNVFLIAETVDKLDLLKAAIMSFFDNKLGWVTGKTFFQMIRSCYEIYIFFELVHRPPKAAGAM